MTTTGQPSSIAGRIEAIRARIRAACERASRDPATVTLVAVSKTQPASAVIEAWRAGCVDFGENRVQEAVPKIAEVRQLLGAESAPPIFHLIGHLQTNKAGVAIRNFSLLHSIDSERLLLAVAVPAAAPVRILLEVNVSGEASKFGLAPADLSALAALARKLPNVELEGLMTVAPVVRSPEEARPVFRQLRTLAQGLGVSTLSMGMTEDFEVAIEEGATLVRIGRAIFGERNS
jgi:hypothetical protein